MIINIVYVILGVITITIGILAVITFAWPEKNYASDEADYVERGKEKNGINIILIGVILLLALSISGYLFPVQPWKRGNIRVPGSIGGEVLSADSKVGAAGSSIAELLSLQTDAAASNPSERTENLSDSVMSENGDAQAQFERGLSYVMNNPSPEDYANAAAWYGKAAEQGHPEAQNSLGVLYFEGKGVPQDYQKAYELYLASAEQGVPEAQFNLGMMFECGLGVPKDIRRAFELYYQAAVAGYSLAQTYVGDAYRNGAGVDADPNEALSWYYMAAEQGDYGAEFWLGYMYDNGMGVEQNAQIAGMWYGKAAQHAREIAESFTNEMPSA